MEQDADINPYAPPQSRLVDESSPEAMRRAMLRHESEIRGVGAMFGLIGAVLLLPALIQGGELVSGRFRGNDFAIWLVILASASAALCLGAGLRRLKPWARVPVAVISGILLLVSIPTVVGPTMNGYVLWLMLSEKGRIVMSPGYERIVGLTPEVKTRFSIVSILFIVLLVLFVLSILVALLAPAFSHR
ncbi:hypothetical protein [Prosthecobacter sp.]|uniref:hypothetical protein n=1 Tax=Prosthecobacter sp. TaxID=1965333 RepID=UPI00378379F5